MCLATQKVIISFIPRCFSHHFLFSVAWHRFSASPHITELLKLCADVCKSLHSFSAPNYTHSKFSCAWWFFHLLFFFYLLPRSLLSISVHLLRCNVQYYTSVVRKKDRWDNCENKQCIKCSTKMLFHHIICIKHELTAGKKSRKVRANCKSNVDVIALVSECDSCQHTYLFLCTLSIRISICTHYFCYLYLYSQPPAPCSSHQPQTQSDELK